jgi:hypothetical protein
LVLTHPRSLYGHHTDIIDSKGLTNTNFRDSRSINIGVLISVGERADGQKTYSILKKGLIFGNPKSTDCNIISYLTKLSSFLVDAREGLVACLLRFFP